MLNYSVHNSKPPKCLIVGVGNIIRSDDAIGSIVCEEMDGLQLPNVSYLHVHQLHTELLEEFSQHEYVIIVDAAVEGKEVNFFAVNPGIAGTASSHAMDAASIAALFEKVYGRRLKLYVCAVRGEDFSLGESITKQARANINKAIDMLTASICRLSIG